MSEINPLNGPILFVSFPDPEIASYVQAVVQGSGQGHQVFIVPTLSELYQQLASIPDSATVITDLMWDGQDASDVLLSMALNYPQVGFIALTNYDVSEILPRFFPIPCVQGIDQVDIWLTLLSNLTEDLRGTQISGYQLTGFIGQSQFARIYSAHQPAIRRDVQLIVMPANSTEESKDSFRRIASARAGNIHPVIYAIYEEGEENERAYVAQEQVIAPSLLQLSLQGNTFDSRLLAKIINITSTAIKHHHTRRIPYQPLRSSHITLSNDGVIKFMNTALPPDQVMPDVIEQLYYLNQIIREFITPTEALHPALGELLTDMEAGSAAVDDVVLRSNAIDIELAPVKFTPQRQETVIAQQQVQQARKSFWVATIVGIVALALFGIWFTTYVLSSYVLVPPGKDFRKQLAITAGDVSIGTKSFPVKAFYMDENEVTIGQYEKFLKATEGKDPKSFLPPGVEMKKPDFTPLNWEAMQLAIKKKKDFEAGPLTNDCPITNIDYADASAYAKWAGKRLPTELEWMRAATGDTNATYPWGNEAIFSKANTGHDKNPNSMTAAGSVDGFRGLNPVDAMASDSSPFDVKGMAGNVSEWVVASPELGPISGDRQPFRGSNHGTEKLIPSKLRTGEVKTTRNPFLGFRCASDSPVE